MAKSRKGKKEEEGFIQKERIVEEKTRNFLEENSKIITGVALAVIAIVLLGYGYKQLISGPKEAKTQKLMIRAQQYFEKDSFNLALVGDGQNMGFKDIVAKYGGTAAGNGAKLYAGISALHIGKYQDAIKYLEDFKSSDALLNARKYGCIGDAKAELKDLKSAAEYYQQAIDADPDNIISAPFNLYKLANVQVLNKKPEEALKTYQLLVDKFETSQEASSAQKEMAYLQASK